MDHMFQFRNVLEHIYVQTFHKIQDISGHIVVLQKLKEYMV
uniref:Uncharacterized protein n=1 Tax=viral metagenome TaxID=1070528 RepID=A0A6C0EP55_9ZZZZ